MTSAKYLSIRLNMKKADENTTAMIAAAILLSTLITTLGSRYVGFESPSEESAWLVDRLTGSVYKCQAPDRGKALCETDVATGSIVGRGKR